MPLWVRHYHKYGKTVSLTSLKMAKAVDKLFKFNFKGNTFLLITIPSN